MTETDTGLRQGHQMPDFELPDQQGRQVELYHRLQEGPLVVVFYRGDW